MNENQEKLTENIKAKKPESGNKTVSNPLSKQLNSLKKPALNNIKPVKTKADTPAKTQKNKEAKRAANPITSETSSIVARINNFNTNKTANRMYAGYMNNANASSHRVIDYSELMNNLNSALSDKTNVNDLFAAVHDLFTEKLNSAFTAFGVFHEKSKCINLKLFNSMGSSYSSKIFLSDDNNPVIQCFNNCSPVVREDNNFLNIPYLQHSPSVLLPLISVGGCKGVMIVGKDFPENRIGLFSFISNYCALFMQNVELLDQTNKFANTDTLTGLYTHRGFQEVLKSELKRA